MEENHAKFVQEREAGAVVFRYQNKTLEFLIIHRTKQDDWSLPKGHQEDGETLEETAVRELREETGLEANHGAYISAITYSHHDATKGYTRQVKVDYFLMTPVHQNDLPDNEEVLKAEWFAYAPELLDKLTYESDRNILKQAVSMLTYNEREAL